MDIERRYRMATLTIANGAALSDAVDVRAFAGGVVSMPAAWTAASIGFKHAPTVDGTYQPLYDDSGTLVAASAAASRDIVLPDTLFACSFVKLWSENAGSDANQGAERSIKISLKG